MPEPLPELNGAEVAEDFFERLGVPYEPEVLAARRVTILRRLSAAAIALEREADEGQEALRARLRDALRAAYDEATSGQLKPLGPSPALVKLGAPR